MKDSGSSSNMLNESMAKSTVKEYIRGAHIKLEFHTANDFTSANRSVIARVGRWDGDGDYSHEELS